jgi:AcrR family transcriptional regulator
MDELGLTLVDEGGLTLRQLMRQARLRIASRGGSVIRTSVLTFMEFIESNPNVFRLLLRERSGTSAAFRQAVLREIQHFIAELADELQKKSGFSSTEAFVQAEAMVTLVFNAGAYALDLDEEARHELAERIIFQLRMIARGADFYHKARNSHLSTE